MYSYRKTLFVPCVLLLLASNAPANVSDTIHFGDESSEKTHKTNAELSKLVDGALGTPARQLLPKERAEWRGGRITFTMAVDPQKPNYFTAKFWGSDTTGEESRLMLFIDGKQIGQRHLGEVDQLDIMSTSARFPDRFFYKTLPIPESLTHGKTSIRCTIEAQGPVNGYGGTIEAFQHKMTKPSRGLYRGYIHTDPFFSPSADEPQGKPVPQRPISDQQAPVTLDDLKQDVNDKVDQLLAGKDAMKVDDVHFLAIAYHTTWSVGYQDPKVLDKVARSIDQLYHEYKRNTSGDVGFRWVGYGPAGEAVHLLASDLDPYLNTKTTGTELTRRDAWAELFQASRDYHSQRRRMYTNQSMILDINLYRANSGLKVLYPDRAWSDEKAVGLLHESIGIKPWSGSLDAQGNATWTRGRNYYLLTEKGMTRELGYVGEYGESVFDLAFHMYECTRPTPGAPGDQAIKDQMVKVSRARSVFRYPAADDDGNRTMRLEGVIGWRDWKYPGNITYDQRPGRDGGPLDVAVSTLDPHLVGYAQQMVEDRQVFPALAKRAKDGRGVAMLAMANTINAYEKLQTLDPSPHRLPMTPGQPDSVFYDPEIGVVAIKNGEEILYASLYWRARYAINNLARVHHITPQTQRDATVRIETRFQDSGLVYTVPDRSNEGFGTRHEKFYKSEGMQLASAGEKQPIAKVPADQEGWEPGDENIFAGKGDFYRMEYGPYLIAMNCTKDKSFAIDVPAQYRGGKELVSGDTSDAAKVTVKPSQTIVIYKK